MISLPKKADKQFWIVATIIIVLVFLVVAIIFLITNWSNLAGYLGLVADSSTQEVPKLAYVP